MKQLITFFTLAYLISWIIWLPLYAPAFGYRELPVIPFQHALGGLGPLIAAFLTTRIYGQKRETIQLFKKMVQVKPVIYLLLALLSPFVLALIAALISNVLNGTPVQLSGLFRNSEFPEFNLLVLFIYNLIFFGFGEEVGWRGFALPRFQVRFNAFTASLVITLFWAVWHWPLFLYRPGYTTMELTGIIGWILSLLTGSLLLTWFYNSSRASLLICATFHATIDIPFTAEIADANLMNYLGILITLWGILTVLIFKPTNLSRGERIQHESHEPGATNER